MYRYDVQVSEVETHQTRTFRIDDQLKFFQALEK